MTEKCKNFWTDSCNNIFSSLIYLIDLSSSVFNLQWPFLVELLFFLSIHMMNFSVWCVQRESKRRFLMKIFDGYKRRNLKSVLPTINVVGKCFLSYLLISGFKQQWSTSTVEQSGKNVLDGSKLKKWKN